MVSILAVSDVHGAKYYNLYLEALKKISVENFGNLIIFGGDMVYKGNVESLRPIVKVTLECLGKEVKILSVFGNEEYDDVKKRLIDEYPEITWLDDELLILEVDDVRIGFVGTRGCLDRPTKWQRKNIPGIEEIYSSRVKKVEFLLKKSLSSADTTVLVSHYSVTYLTLLGEPRYAWPEMGSRRLEKVLLKVGIPLAFHGHAHNSKKTEVVLGKTKVYNIALPARKSITTINIEKIKQTSLLSFMR